MGVKLLAKEEVNRFNLVGTEFLFQPPADNPEKKFLTFFAFSTRRTGIWLDGR